MLFRFKDIEPRILQINHFIWVRLTCRGEIKRRVKRSAVTISMKPKPYIPDRLSSRQESTEGQSTISVLLKIQAFPYHL